MSQVRAGAKDRSGPVRPALRKEKWLASAPPNGDEAGTLGREPSSHAWTCQRRSPKDPTGVTISSEM